MGMFKDANGKSEIRCAGWNTGIIAEKSDGIHPDFSKPYVRRLYVSRDIQLPDGKIAKAGDILIVNNAADPRTNGRYTILGALPQKPSAQLKKEVEEELRRSDEEFLAKFAVPVKASVEKVVAMAAGMSRYDEGAVESATKANPNAAYPRMVMASATPCYVCGVKPHKVPVALLERSKDDKTSCCAHCAQHILGYEIQEDGHLTRKPPEV